MLGMGLRHELGLVQTMRENEYYMLKSDDGGRVNEILMANGGRLVERGKEQKGDYVDIELDDRTIRIFTDLNVDALSERESAWLAEKMSALVAWPELDLDMRTQRRDNASSAGEEVVTYYRVEVVGHERIVVDESGNTSVEHSTPIWLTRMDPTHTRYFAALKLLRGAEVLVKAFDVPRWFDDDVMGSGVSRYEAGVLGLMTNTTVKFVDRDQPGRPETKLELGSEWARELSDVIIPGSGRVFAPPTF